MDQPIDYVNKTTDYEISGYIHDDPQHLKLKLFVDADFAGDREDAKSLSGSFLAVIGPNHESQPPWGPLGGEALAELCHLRTL